MGDQSMAEFSPVSAEARIDVRAKAFLNPETLRELKHVAETTVPLNLKGVNERGIGNAVNNFLSNLQLEGVVVSDIMGRSAVAYPNVNVEVGGGFNRLQRSEISMMAKGLARDSQEADFWKAALQMKGFDWGTAQREMGVKNPGEARARLKDLEKRAPEKLDQLTDFLLGRQPEKTVPANSGRKPLIRVGREARILPAAQYARVDAKTASKYEKGGVTLQTAIVGLGAITLVGLGVSIYGCITSPIEATASITGGQTETSPTLQPTATETAPSAPTPVALMEFEEANGVDLISWNGTEGQLSINGQVFATATAVAPDNIMIEYSVEGQDTPERASLSEIVINQEEGSVARIDRENHLLISEFFDGRWQEVNLEFDGWINTYEETVANAPRLDDITAEQFQGNDNPIIALARQLSYFKQLNPQIVNSISPGMNHELSGVVLTNGVRIVDLLVPLSVADSIRPMAWFKVNLLGRDTNLIPIEIVFNTPTGPRSEVVIFMTYRDGDDGRELFEAVSSGKEFKISWVGGFDEAVYQSQASTEAKANFKNAKELIDAQPEYDDTWEALVKGQARAETSSYQLYPLIKAYIRD